MAKNPTFDLFEEICAELRGQQESVLIEDDFSPETIRDLKRWAREMATRPAIAKAIRYLENHFAARVSTLPFNYDLDTGRVTAVEREFIDFVSNAGDQRSIGRESRQFEVATSQHLAKKLTGFLCRVGSPRKRHRTRKDFGKYLVREFAFKESALVLNDKDGGFDILWFPPLGAFPLRAIVSIQCKNSPYNRDVGLESVGRAKQTLGRHSHATAEETHLHCVIYNDYVDEAATEHSRDVGFVPLGLTDLAPLTTRISLSQL